MTTDSDRDYFDPSLVDRLKASAAAFGQKVRTLIAFHTAFQRGLLGEDGELRPEAKPMLEHLARFCFATGSTYHDDPRRHAMNEGRRQVWLEIERGLRFDRKKIETLRRKQEEQDADDD